MDSSHLPVVAPKTDLDKLADNEVAAQNSWDVAGRLNRDIELSGVAEIVAPDPTVPSLRYVRICKNS